MDFEDEPFVVDRADSFPQDRAYPSRSTHSQIHKRSTKDSLNSDKHIHRQGTGDFEPRRRLRYTIPLRHKKNTLRDEEKGYPPRIPYRRGDSTQLSIDRESSKDTPPPEFLEIISTKWVPDEEGKEVVTLTVKDQEGDQKQEDMHSESRWKHIQSDAMTLGQFYREVMRTPGLGDDDLALVGRLLNKVRNTSEKKFVHGRYLKPITLVYEGEDPDLSASHHVEERPVRKTATFVSFPVFTTSHPKRHTSTKEFEGHPVRSLLQSRYRLESTRRRDKEQVITKTTSIRDQLAHDTHVVHVPQIWALMINNYTIITCAALNASVLRADTIKLMSYADAQLDEATWSVHFTDARGKVFYLPLRYCKTWFDLVKHITDHCLHDEYSFIRDQLLKGGPVYQLVVANGGSLVDADKWSKLIEETKTEVIHLRLVDKENLDSRLLITYCDEEGNEIPMDSDSSTATSPIFSSDDGVEDSDTSESSVSSGTNPDDTSYVIGRLRRLQASLRDAMDKKHAKKVEYLKEHKIPALEQLLLELTAAGLDLDPSPDDDNPRRNKTMPKDHNPPLIPNERYRARVRSRSRSTSRARSVKLGNTFSGSTYDLSREEPSARGRLIQPWTVHRDQSGYFRDVDYNAASRARPRMRSHMPNPHSLSRTSTLSTHPRSRWDLLRSRVRDRQLPGLRSPIVDSNDIYYRPSDKQLARSYWDLVRDSVLEGGIYKLRDMEGVKNKEEVADQTKASIASTDDKQKRGLSSLRRLSDFPDSLRTDSSTVSPTTMIPPAGLVLSNAQNVPAKGILGSNQGGHDPGKPKRVLFSNEGKPKLKNLVKLAQQGSAQLPSIATSENSSPVSSQPVTDLPIFLWSTEHQPFEGRSLAENPPQLPTIPETPSTQKPAEEPKKIIHTSKTDELILHAVLAEVHAAIRKPKRGRPEYGALYEKIAEKTYADVASSVNAIRNARANVPNGVATNVNNLVSHSRRPSLAYASLARRLSESSRSVVSLSGRNDVGEIKVEVFDLARTILFAFVPKGYEAPVISKYWGALHSLLTKDGTVLDYVCSRLLEIRNLIHSIQMGVRAEDGSKQQRYQIPRALPAAFQHLVLLLVVIGSISNWSEYSWNQMRSAFDDCEGLLVEGRKQLLLMIHTDDYRDSSGFQAVDAEALLSLILSNLISSMSTNDDFHLTEVYAEYTTNIQGIVRDSASVKVYDDIKLLREELDIIKCTLTDQDTTLREFKSTIPLTYGVPSLSISILDRTLESTSQRIDDFDELQSQAETARFLAAQSISLKAESNNKAIIVFTVVTIVFLPLSFVTSYLGMNTSDLRDMKSGQTLFWAIGAPVAVVVLSAALMAAFYGTLTQRVLGRAWRGKEKSE